jgi:hypothetical protein
VEGGAAVVDRLGATPLAAQASERGLGVAEAEYVQEVFGGLLATKILREAI